VSAKIHSNLSSTSNSAEHVVRVGKIYAAVFSECHGERAEARFQNIVKDAALRLNIKKVIFLK
jgi:hypothetical protein